MLLSCGSNCELHYFTGFYDQCSLRFLGVCSHHPGPSRVVRSRKEGLIHDQLAYRWWPFTLQNGTGYANHVTGC